MKVKTILEKIKPYEDMIENNISFEDEDGNILEFDKIFIYGNGEICIKLERS